MSDEIEVNGNQFSWGSIIFKVDGDRYYGFNSISFSDKRTRAKGYGMTRSQAPRSRSRGKYEVDPVKVKGPVASVAALRKALAAQSSNGANYGDVECEILLQFIDTGEEPSLVEFARCVWASNSSSLSEGPDGLEEEFEMDTMRIVRDGLTLFDSEAA